MDSQQEALYIGIDLDDNWTQISYYRPGMKEPETVSTITGEARYRIPTALCRNHECGLWYLADTQGKDAKDRIRIDSLWAKSIRGETVVLEQEYAASELLLLFLRKIMRLIPGLMDFEQIHAITVHIREVDLAKVLLIQEIMGRMGIQKERVFVQDSKESFCHFAMNQEKELMLHEVVLFQCEENELTAYRLSKDGKTTPQKVEIETLYLGMLPTEPMERDMSFAEKAGEVFAGRIVSSVYLIGQGLEGGWLQHSLPVLCRGRRVFQGKNLYTKGACHESIMQMHKEEMNYIYFSESIVKKNIFVQVRNGNRTFFQDLVEAGSSCYEVKGSCQVLLSGEPTVDIWLQAPDSKEARVYIHLLCCPR